jgi:hypothetical protein
MHIRPLLEGLLSALSLQHHSRAPGTEIRSDLVPCEGKTSLHCSCAPQKAHICDSGLLPLRPLKGLLPALLQQSLPRALGVKIWSRVEKCST